VIRSQLNSYSGSDPIWGFVALLSHERFTGEAAVGLDPRVRLFAVDGRVYFAEREGDAPVSTRLVNCGAVSTTQLEHGAVRIGDTTSLARLFQREPGIDRDAVELTIETATEALLESIANKAVGMPEVFPLRHHSSGIHHWLRTASQPLAPMIMTTVEHTAEAAVLAPAADSAAPVAVEVAPMKVAPPIEEAAIEVVAAEVVAAEVTPLTPEGDQFVEPSASPPPVLHEWPITPLAAQTVAVPVEVEVEAEVEVEEPMFVPIVELAPQPDLKEHLWGNSYSSSSHTPPLQPAPFSEATPLVESPATAEEPVAIEEPAHNGFTVLPTLSALGNREATTSEQLHAALMPRLESEPAPVEEPIAEPGPAAHSMPTLGSLTPLASLTSLTSPAEPETAETNGTSVSDFFSALDESPALQSDPAVVTTEYPSFEPGPQATGLPKLAAAPISMDALAAFEAGNNDAAGPWNGATHNPAVEIWEMIDSLDGPAPSDDQLVASGTEKRSRGWLRGRKG